MEDAAYAEMYGQEDRHWWFRGRRELLWALLRRVDAPSSPRLLDAGCGTGRNLVEFGTLARTLAGIDPSAEAVEFCRRRGLENVRCAGLEDLPFGPAEFDLLLACDVLEHVSDDRLALKELLRVAAPGATLLVTVPAYQWMWTHHDDQLHHLRRYTRRALKRLVEDSGWNVVHDTYFNSLLLPIVTAMRLVSRGSSRQGHTDLDRTPALLNGALGLPMKLEAALIARGARFPAGVSIGVISVKSA